jgi:hypothetical protein
VAPKSKFTGTDARMPVLAKENEQLKNLLKNQKTPKRSSLVQDTFETEKVKTIDPIIHQEVQHKMQKFRRNDQSDYSSSIQHNSTDFINFQN